MNTMGIVAIIFILVLAFSVVGFSVGFGGKDKDNGDNTKQVVNDTPAQTQAIYTAEILGTVKELPTIPGMYKMIAYTNESDITKIDNSIKSISGVSNLGSQFKMNPDVNISTYIYIADVVGYDLNDLQFRETVLSNSFFIAGSQIFPYAKVEFSPKVSFVSKDLNITKEYEFGNPEVLVLANANTQQGDTIKFQMNALFVGETFSKSENYEISNESASPKAYNFLEKGKFMQDYFAVSLPSQIDENKFTFLKQEFDFNYFVQSGNTILQFANDVDLEKVLEEIKSQDFLKDFNLTDGNVESQRVGTTYLDYAVLMDKNIGYKNNVPTSLDYEVYKIIPKQIEFRFTAYVSKDKILGIYAEPVSGS